MLPVDVQEEIDYTINLLNRLTPTDPPLPFPFSSQVAGQLRELRCHYGRRLFRILYRRSSNLFILLHTFEKHTAKVPEADIAIAEARWADFRARMDALRRRPPRAAGHDAP
jgi:phage-related protein